MVCEHQERMLDEKLILVDENDVKVGEATKREAHRASNLLLHRAFSVFLFDEKCERMLLQRRSMLKITFPGLWTNACCSHPLVDEGDGLNGCKKAANRKLKQELGTSVEFLDYVGRILYKASEVEWGEHEVDYILFSKFCGEIKPNENEVMDLKWVTKHELNKMMENQKFTPWFMLIKDQLMLWWTMYETKTLKQTEKIIKF